MIPRFTEVPKCTHESALVTACLRVQDYTALRKTHVLGCLSVAPTVSSKGRNPHHMPNEIREKNTLPLGYAYLWMTRRKDFWAPEYHMFTQILF